MVPSVAFARPTQARLPLGPARAGVYVTTLQASLHAADRSVAPPPCRGFVAPLRRRALTRRREPCYRGPWRLPGPDSHRLAAVSLSLGYAINLLSCSVPFGARAAGRTLPHEKPLGEKVTTLWPSVEGRRSAHAHRRRAALCCLVASSPAALTRLWASAPRPHQIWAPWRPASRVRAQPKRCLSWLMRPSQPVRHFTSRRKGRSRSIAWRARPARPLRGIATRATPSSARSRSTAASP